MAVVTAAPASTATSSGWGALSSTYNNQVRVSGYGQAYIGGGGSNITTDYVLTDPAKDGNTVYAQTDYQFFRICSPGRRGGHLVQ